MSGVVPTIKDAQDFTAGMIYKLLGENDLPGLEQCVQSSDKVVNDLIDIIADFKALDITSIIKAV